MTRDQHYRSRVQIEKYLNQRADDLLLLNLDLACKPFSSIADAAELVIAVDWSEVYAYIFALPAPDGDPLVPALGRDIADAAHQIALITLFEHFPGEVILIPPYMQEMTHFIAKIRGEASATVTEIVADASAQVYSSMTDSPALKDMVDLARTVATQGDDDASFNRFIEKLDETDRDVILSWVKERYASFLLFARLAGMDVLNALTFLLHGADGRPRLRMLADNYPEMARRFVSEPLSFDRWDVALRRVSTEKSRGSRLRDAQALAYLDRLIPMMHARGKQMLFVTRSNDIVRVMDEHPGRFACLTSHYYSPGAGRIDDFTANPPSIVRSWRSYFELGLALACTGSIAQGTREDNESAQSSPSSKITEVIKDSSLEAIARREGVHTGRLSPSALEKIRKDLASDIQNQRALISTHQPRIPKLRKRSGDRLSDFAELAVKFFIRYVTDVKLYARDRERARGAVLQSAIEAQKAIPYVSVSQHVRDIPHDGERADPWHLSQSSCRSVVQELINNVDPDEVVSDVSSPIMRDLLRRVYQDVQDGASEGIDAAAKALPKISAGDTSLKRDLARLETALAFASGFPDRLEYLLNRDAALFEQLPELSFGRVIYQFMKADVATVRISPLVANGLLRRYARTQMKVAQRRRPSRNEARAIAALVNGWLRHHLDWVEEWGDRLDNFPRSEDDRFELEVIIHDALELRSMIDEQWLGARLQRSLWNNVIYGAARVTPSVGIEARVVMNNMRGDIRVGDRNLTSLITENLLAPPVLHLVAKFEHFELSPEESDTLAYHYLKQAYWLATLPTLFPGPAARKKAFSTFCDQAEGLFNHAMNAKSERDRQLILEHRKLLNYTRTVIEGRPEVFHK